jgi:hypothetical protein
LAVRQQNKSGTEGRGNKAAEDDGDAREGVRGENVSGRSGRFGSREGQAAAREARS